MQLVKIGEVFSDCVVLCTGRTMAKVHYDEDLVRAAIRRMKAELDESINLSTIIEVLYSKDIINEMQYQQIMACEGREGRNCATSRLLNMVISAEVEVPGFMKVLKEKIPWEHTRILEGVKKYKSGEWITPGLSCE